MMWVVIKLYFAAFDDPSLPEIMGQTGDIGTVAAFAMVYFRNPFLERFAISVDERSAAAFDWDFVKSKVKVLIYDVISYVLAWHALAAIPLRRDWSGSFLYYYLDQIFLALILLNFCLAACILIWGRRRFVTKRESRHRS